MLNLATDFGCLLSLAMSLAKMNDCSIFHYFHVIESFE